MPRLLIGALICLLAVSGCSQGSSEPQTAGNIKFSSRPGEQGQETTNLLLISSPWSAQQRFSINFPEHCWGRGLPNVSHSSNVQIDKPWLFNTDSSSTWFEYEARPGVVFRASASAESMAVRLKMELDNRSDTAATDIRTLICLRPGGLDEFNDHDYARTFVAVDGKPVRLGADTHYDGPLPEEGRAYWALNVAGGPDNLTFEDLGWFRPGSGPGRIVEERADPPLIAVRASNEPERWLAMIWRPARLLFSNSSIPCIHSDPLPPDCPPGATSSAVGLILFHEGNFQGLLERAKAEL
ncbi:hypothetical protein ACFL4X_02005 [Gemmatimonadota bacterium]